MAKVEMYSKQVCPSCIHAKQLFDSKSVSYTEYKIDASDDPERKKLAEMQARAPGHRTVPAIFINDQFIGGYDALRALNEAGELDPLLVE